jgi:hypothetical protein
MEIAMTEAICDPETGESRPSIVTRSIPQPTDPATLSDLPVDDMDADQAVAFWRRRICWREVAALIATGQTVNEAARNMQIEPYRIRRNLVRSARFRRWIYEEQSALMEAARRKVAALQIRLPAALAGALDEGNTRLLTWLAEELKDGDLGLASDQWATRPPRPPAGQPAPAKPKLSNFDLGLQYLGQGISPTRQNWTAPSRRELDKTG